MNWLRRILGLKSRESESRATPSRTASATRTPRQNNTNRPRIIPLDYAAAQTSVTLSQITENDIANRVSDELTDDGNLEMGIRVLQHATRITLMHTGTIWNLAVYYRFAGEFDAAARLNRLLLAINPRDDEARWELEDCEKKHSRCRSPQYEAARDKFVDTWKKSIDPSQLPEALAEAERQLTESMRRVPLLACPAVLRGGRMLVHESISWASQTSQTLRRAGTLSRAYFLLLQADAAADK